MQMKNSTLFEQVIDRLKKKDMVQRSTAASGSKNPRRGGNKSKGNHIRKGFALSK